MPWGKHRGKHLSQVPSSYFWWLLESKDSWEGNLNLLDAVVCELEERTDALTGRHLRPVATPAADFRAVAEKWFRQMAMKHHPDRGGNIETMQALVEGRELLRQLTNQSTNG